MKYCYTIHCDNDVVVEIEGSNYGEGKNFLWIYGNDGYDIVASFLISKIVWMHHKKIAE